ncbi:MAG: MFS transporter [Myxococcota bacterium]
MNARLDEREPLLARLALHRPELRAWALYDWANSAMVTTVVAAVFPVYFNNVAGAGLAPGEPTQRFAIATTASLAIIALISPVLGAIADFTAAKKRFLAGFLAIGTLATACMFFIYRGDWLLALALFVLANIGAAGSFVFYDSLLPHVARPHEMDRLSTSGYALGYLGGGLLLALNLAWILKPDLFGLPAGENLTDAQTTLPTRLALLSVAVWWAVFSIPLLRRVPEPPRQLEADEGLEMRALGVAFTRIRETLGELRGYRQAFLMLLAFLIYNDGIGTIIRMAAIYGAEIGIGRNALIAAIVLVQFVGIPFALLFGAIAGRIGPKRAILAGLVVYMGISALAFFMRTAAHFFALAVLVGMVQGGTQALSRSLFASMIPKHKSAEFFAFFAIAEKFAGMLGPAIFAAVIFATGSSRNAILSVIVFFFAGGLLLLRVNEDEGRQRARTADEAAHAAREGR